MFDFRDRIKESLRKCRSKGSGMDPDERYYELTQSFIKTEFDYNKSEITFEGMISNVDLNGCRNSTWSLTYSTKLSYNGSVAVMGIDADESCIYLDMSDCTRVVIGSSGVIGKEFPDKSEFDPYFEDALITMGNILNDRLSELQKSLMDLRTQINCVYTTVAKFREANEPLSESIWVSKGDSRIKIPRTDLDKFLNEGFIVSPEKKATKVKKTTTKNK